MLFIYNVILFSHKMKFCYLWYNRWNWKILNQTHKDKFHMISLRCRTLNSSSHRGQEWKIGKSRGEGSMLDRTKRFWYAIAWWVNMHRVIVLYISKEQEENILNVFFHKKMMNVWGWCLLQFEYYTMCSYIKISNFAPLNIYNYYVDENKNKILKHHILSH